MSTPAAAALDGAAGSPAGGNGSPGASGSTPAPGVAPNASPSANQPFYDTWIKPDVPEAADLKGWLANKNFSDPVAFVKSARETERSATDLRAAANLKGYPVATKNADGTPKPPDANAVNAWRTAMGVPDSPDKYDFGDLSKNPNVDPHFSKMLAEELYEVHTPAALATAQGAAYERAVVRHIEHLNVQDDRRAGEELRALEVEWGPNFKERAAIAARGRTWIYNEIGAPNPTKREERMIELALGGTTKFMKAMWKFGSGNQEIGSPPGGGGAPKGFEGGTAAAAQAEYDQLLADRSAGKITDAQWRSTGSKRERELGDLIASGYAPPLS